jgi:gamma-glutamyltranspeptidase / glutathione hydrolase
MYRTAHAFLIAGILVGAIVGITTVAFTRDYSAPAFPVGVPASPSPDELVGSSPHSAPTQPQATATPTPEPEPEPHVQAVVSAHELATRAGMHMLEQGGSAADAAVAVAATLSVVEPWYSHALGGGTWALYYDAANEELVSLDGVGPTGSNATVAAYSRVAGSWGMHQANTPGAWDGWMLLLDRYGRLDLGDVLEPAIMLARDGYIVDQQMAMFLARNAILARPDTARIWAPNGRVLRAGDVVHQHNLADTFEALVAAYNARLPEGRSAAIQAARDHYYRGPIAEAIVAFSDANGGYLTLQDFAGFEANFVEPISVQYNDEITVYQNPPNSQGITMLLALNTLKALNLSSYDPLDPDAVHLQVEAIKLAFADRFFHVGDPARVDVPVARLLSDAHADSQRARINMNSAMRWPIADGLDLSQSSEASVVDDPNADPTLGHGDTTTFHVVDAEGNGIAVTTSLGSQFYVVGDTGIHINNRMRFLSLANGNPNQLAPGYKVRHTSNPYMAFRNGRLHMLGGNTGADTQAQAQVQQFLNVVEFGFSAQEAVTRPRFIVMSFPSTIYPHGAANVLRMEGAFPESLANALRARGHAIQRLEGDSFGNASLIVINDDGTDAQTGAEPRNGTSLGVVVPAEP